VTQMVLSRSAFGRRGAYFPAFFQIVIATGWIAINTWIILDLSVALLEKLGIPGTPATKVVVVLVLTPRDEPARQPKTNSSPTLQLDDESTSKKPLPTSVPVRTSR